jgi:hypothetical protein
VQNPSVVSTTDAPRLAFEKYMPADGLALSGRTTWRGIT